MTRITTALLATGLLLGAPLAFANGHQQPEPAAAGSHDHAAMAPDFAKLDINSDGQIEKTELAKDDPMAGHFDMMDKDKNGKVSKAEFDAMHSEHSGH